MNNPDTSWPRRIKTSATVELKFPLTRRPGMVTPFLVQGVKDTFHDGATEYDALEQAKNYCIRLKVETQELMDMIDAHLEAIEKEIWKNP